MNKILFHFAAILLIGCAAIGTKTLYKSQLKSEIGKIGFADIQNKEKLSEIFSKTNETFKESIEIFSKGKGHYKALFLNEEMDYGNPNNKLIMQKCNELGLDAVIISRLKFIHVTYTLMFVPIAQNYDTEVEMKLIDKNGNLILSTRHNTYKGNSYMVSPTAERTVMDGAKGALKRIYLELEK